MSICSKDETIRMTSTLHSSIRATHMRKDPPSRHHSTVGLVQAVYKAETFPHRDPTLDDDHGNIRAIPIHERHGNIARLPSRDDPTTRHRRVWSGLNLPRPVQSNLC